MLPAALITDRNRKSGPRFPQKLLQFPRIQAIGNPAEAQDAEPTGGQKAAFTEDLSAPVQI